MSRSSSRGGRRGGGAGARGAGSESGFSKRRLRAEAVDAADNVQRSYPACFKETRTDVRRLVTMMGLKVKEDPGLTGRAFLEQEASGPIEQTIPGIWGTTVHSLGEILVRPDVGENTRRFAIAHELGHVALEGYPELVSRLTEPEKETYANTFAAEILVGAPHRGFVKKAFSRASGPADLMELSNSVGVSARTLLIFAHEHGWFEDLDRIWVEARIMPDSQTGRDACLRVHRAYAETRRWVLPRMTPVSELFGDDRWLVESMEQPVEREGMPITLQERTRRSRAIRKTEALATVRSLKLRDSRWVDSPQILISITIAT